jgi:hypothetical protein
MQKTTVLILAAGMASADALRLQECLKQANAMVMAYRDEAPEGFDPQNAISFTNFTTLANTALDFYVRTNPVGQNIQDKPLLRDLNASKKEFPGGQGYVSGAVQGAFASDQAGFFQWYSHTDQVSFVHPDNILRAKYLWRECHAGIVLDFTELKQRGIGVDMSGQPVKSSGSEVQIVKDWLASVTEDDFGESLSRAYADALWRDGSQASQAVVGILGVLDDDPTSGTIGGLDRGTYSWWRHRVKLNIGFSEANQTLTKTLRREVRQLRRNGGRPDLVYAGSDMLEALESEVQAKGSYTQNGFKGQDSVDIAMGKSPEEPVFIRGIGWVKYEPWLDDHGLSKRLYVLDSRHVKLMPMKGQDMTAHKAVRPYDQFVLFKSVTGTLTLSFDQLNCHGVYALA